MHSTARNGVRSTACNYILRSLYTTDWPILFCIALISLKCRARICGEPISERRDLNMLIITRLNRDQSLVLAKKYAEKMHPRMNMFILGVQYAGNAACITVCIRAYAGCIRPYAACIRASTPRLKPCYPSRLFTLRRILRR